MVFLLGVLLLMLPNVAQSWTAAKRLTWTSGSSLFSAIATDSSSAIHLVWEESKGGNYEIYYKKSTNGGAGWITKRLTWTTGDSRFSDVAVDAGNAIHIVWQESKSGNGNTEIFYKKSTNGGAIWTTKRLTWTAGDSKACAIATDSSGAIHVVWEESKGANYEIFYKKSPDGGVSWTTKRLTWTADKSLGPSIAVDSSNTIHIVWNDYTPGNSEIFYKKSMDGGISWTTKRLTWTANHGGGADVATDSDNNIHIVWSEVKSGYDHIFYRRSTDGGFSWTEKQLTFNADDSWSPAIATDVFDNIYIVWSEYFDLAGGSDIFCQKSTNGGSNWTLARLSWTDEFSSGPAIAADTNDIIHVVWHDSTPGNQEIYYTNSLSPTVSLVSPENGAVLDNGRTDGEDCIIWDFDWADVEGATKYLLYVKGSNAKYPIINCQIFSSSYHFESCGSYIIDHNRFDWRWKVAAYVNGNWSDWSEERYFDVEPVNTDPPSNVN